jgi:type I restriction enzyme, R subunit
MSHLLPYQTEAALEKEFIQDLINQGYENPLNLNTPEAMLANVRVQLQSLNNVTFLDGEWSRFVEEYLDKPSDNLVEKQGKYMKIIFTISFLMMVIFKTST